MPGKVMLSALVENDGTTPLVPLTSTAARFFSVVFVCVAANTWQEISRTAVQT